MLDISIKNIDKVIVTDDHISTFLNAYCNVQEKLDGTKLTVIRKDTPFNPDAGLDNFVFAYKNNLLVPEEFANVDRETIKQESMGASQYALVFDHFERIMPELGKIPRNTEFLIEFLMNKPTITRDYERKHAMVLLGYSPTTYDVRNMRVDSKTIHLRTMRNKQYAEIMHLDLPKVVFSGVPSDFITSTTYPEALQEFKDTMLNIPSVYGGKTEGVVVHHGISMKILQDDQHDPEARLRKKLRYKMDQDKEAEYYEKIHRIASGIVSNILYDGDYRNIMTKLSNDVFGKDDYPVHTKKTRFNVMDDLFLTSKMKLMRLLPGNNNALFIGRMQPPTKMHMRIISDGLKKYDNIVVGIVKGKKSDGSRNPFPFEIQKEMVLKVFPNVEVVQVGNGNIIGITSKLKMNVNAVLAGSDRVDGYRKQLVKNPDTTVDETLRDENGISGTKVRQAIVTRDKKSFKENMHRKTWRYWEKLYYIMHPNELEEKLRELSKFENFEKYIKIKDDITNIEI